MPTRDFRKAGHLLAILCGEARPFGWFYRVACYGVVAVALAGAAFPELVRAEKDPVRIYTTSEERRDAGIKHELTDWLTVSGLVEVEYLNERFKVSNGPSSSFDDVSASLQLDVELSPLSWAKAELVYEYDDESHDHTLDEAFVSFEAGNFELEFGKLYVPFGSYISHFASGPLLEFGETRASAVTLSYGIGEQVDFSAFIYRGDAREIGDSGSNNDWGLAIDGSPAEFASLGLSYLSDLADSEENFLNDAGDRYQRRVAGVSGYVVIGNERMEFSAEYTGALRAFRELESDRDQPEAWNVEVAYFPQNKYEWALRLEGSKELEDAPRLQAGASITWRISRYISFTLDYLQGRFRRGLAEDMKERELQKRRQVNGQLSIEF